LVTDDEIGSTLKLEKLVAIVRDLLRSLFDGEPIEVPSSFANFVFERVNVTLRTNGQVRGSMSGRGDTFREQLFDAVSRASRDTRFTGAIVKADLEMLTIEVWLQISSKLVQVEDRHTSSSIRLGEDGVEVEKDTAFAYYKPSVAITSSALTIQALFSDLCQKAGLPEDSWKAPSCIIRKTSWIHFCGTPDGRVVRMNALRPIDGFLAKKESFLDWVKAGASYLRENQHSDGSFCYQYRPFLNRARKTDANPVRASGCAYAIAAAASSPYLDRDQDLIKCANRAVDSILRCLTRLEDGVFYIANNRGKKSGKLGSTALLLLALMTPALASNYEEEAEQLLAGIKSSQLRSGIFQCTFGDAYSRESQANFFPGQAILALTVKAGRGDSSCRECYRAAFRPYRDHFRNSPTTAFVGWHADAWSRAAMLDSNSEYAEFVFEQVDWLLQYQLVDSSDSSCFGGYSWNGRPPGYSSIVYTEAIARAAALAHVVGDVRLPKYRDAFISGIAFCDRLRLRREQSLFFPDPKRAIGGMTTSLSNFEVRSDVVQHAMTLGLAALDLMSLLN
jgi:AMMECR1 domain-containing protein